MIFLLICDMMLMLNSKEFLIFNSSMKLESSLFSLFLTGFFVSWMISSFFFLGVSKMEKSMINTISGVVIYLMLWCFMAESLIIFLFLFEFSLIPMIFLIMNFSLDKDKINSSFFMMSMNMFGSIPFLISLSNFSALNQSLYTNFNFYSNLFSCINLYLYLFFCFIFLFKLPFIFFHFWLPKAHVSSLGNCSILLAGLMLKLGGVGILKYFFKFKLLYMKLFILMMGMLCLAMIIIPVVMYRSFDLKYLIASSSLAHMTFIPVFSNSQMSIAYWASFMVMVGHGIISSMMFLFLTLYYEQSHSRYWLYLKGSMNSSFLSLMMMMILFVMNFGFPPFLNFFSEYYTGLQMLAYSKLSMMMFFFFMIASNMTLINSYSMISLNKSESIISWDLNLNLLTKFFYSILFYVMLIFFI